MTSLTSTLAMHYHSLGTQQQRKLQHQQQQQPPPVTGLQQSPVVLSSNWRKLQEVLNRGGGAELPAEGKGTTTAATRSGSVGVRVKRERKEQEEAEIEEGEGKGAETKAGDAWRQKKRKRKQEDREGQEQGRLKPEPLQVVGKKRKADNIVTEDAKKKQTEKINHRQPTPTTASKKRKMLSPMQGASYHDSSKKSIQKNGDVIPPKITNGVVTTTNTTTARKTKTEIKPTSSRTTSTTTAISDQMKSADSPDSLSSPMQFSQSKVGRYLSLDCEMVGCGQPPPHERSQLARVSIVNFHGHVILDTFVRPPEPVTDWRTAISGVRPSDMATAIPFDSAREQVRALLRGRILVGHSVHNDLTVLGLKHPRRDIRDTAKFSVLREKYGCGRTPALRVLSLEILGLEIQKGEHSSTTDARVCMLIYKRFRTEFENEIVKLFGKAKPAIHPPPEPTLGPLIPIVKEKGNQRITGEEVARGDYEHEDGNWDMAEVESIEHEDGDDGQVKVGKIQGSGGKKKNKKKKKKGKYR